jgi:hypothetical protein
MSVSNVSSSLVYPASGVAFQWQQEMHDYHALAVAIQSGNLTSILKAFSAWQQDLQANSAANAQTTHQTQPFGSNTKANADFQALSGALKTGDVASAQTAFASLQKDMQGGSGTAYYRLLGGQAATSNNNATPNNNNSPGGSSHATAPAPAAAAVPAAAPSPAHPLDNLA